MRLIDADELKKNFQDDLCFGIACADCSMQNEGFCRAERWIDIQPTIEPITQGTWIEYDNSHCECPFCHSEWSYFDNETERFDYCPNCGARLVDGKESV